MKKFVVPEGWIDDEDPKYIEAQKIRQARLKTEHDLEAAKEKTAVEKAKADAVSAAKAETEMTQHNADAVAQAAAKAAEKNAPGQYPAGNAGPYPAGYAGPYPDSYMGPFPANYAGPYPASYTGPFPAGYKSGKSVKG